MSLDVDYGRISTKPDFYNIYFSVYPRKDSSSGKETNVAYATCAYTELDGKDFNPDDPEDGKHEAKALVDKLIAGEGPLPIPTLVVDSGHGYHIYWLFSEPISAPEGLKQVKRINKAAAYKLHGDEGVFDLARILRVPGTNNLKDPENPLPVSVIWQEKDAHYSLKTLESVLEQELKQVKLIEEKVKDIKIGDAVKIELEELKVSSRIKELIQAKQQKGKPLGKYKSRNERDFAVIMAMLRAGHTVEEVMGVFVQYPVGDKYREQGEQYLTYSIAKAQLLMNQEKGKKKRKPKLVIKTEGIQTFLKRRIEAPEDVIAGGLLPARGKAIIGGAPKMGKSFFATNMAFCIATGCSFLKRFEITKPRPVLFIQQEIPEQVLQRRFDLLIGLTPYRPTEFALTDDSFKVANLPNVRIDKPDGCQAVINAVEQTQAQVVFLDPLYKFHNIKENDEQGMKKLVDALDRIIAATGCSLAIVHHHGKRQPLDVKVGAELLRGSSVLAAWGNSFFILSRERGREDKYYLTLTIELSTGIEPPNLTVVRDLETCWYEIVREKPERAPALVQQVVKNHPQITSTDLVRKLKDSCNVSERTAFNMIKNAQQDGLITSHKEGRHTFYDLP